MDSAKNGRWIIPFKKFVMIRINYDSFEADSEKYELKNARNSRRSYLNHFDVAKIYDFVETSRKYMIL